MGYRADSRPSRGGYDVGLACLNGHGINGSSTRLPQFNAAFCGECGARSIDECPACQRPLLGSYRGSFLSTSPWTPSAFCTECGEAYPWTSSRLEAARLLVEEAEDLDDDERAVLSGTFEDLVGDTPRTPVAVNRFKKLATKAGAPTASALKDVLVGVVTEGAKRAIWGP